MPDGLRSCSPRRVPPESAGDVVPELAHLGKSGLQAIDGLDRLLAGESLIAHTRRVRAWRLSDWWLRAGNGPRSPQR